MRPERLELSGFTAFREPITVDFSDIELFAITGETGSGKSSLIDALTFALYGSVARYGRRGQVAPIISSGMNEARIRFDFELGDRRLTAVRVVRRTGTGATTAEARLEERDGDVLASGADDVTAAVTRLVGLEFSHFTRSVVLPQGDFARFLHDKPSDRQSFLKALLDLGVLERIRDRAKQRVDRARQENEVRTERLIALEFATKEAEAEAQDREKRLAGLADEVGDLVAGMESVNTKIVEHHNSMDGLRQDRELLADIEPPAGLDRITDELETAWEQIVTAQETVKKARQGLERARKHRYELPKMDDVERIERDHQLLGDLSKKRETLIDPSDEVATTKTQLKEAAESLRVCQTDWESVRRSYDAAGLLEEVDPGDPCPVCLRPLSELPEHSGQDDVHRSRAALQEAKEIEQTARTQHDDALKKWEKYETDLHHLEERLDDVRTRLADHPDDHEALRKHVEAADESLIIAEKDAARADEALEASKAGLAKAEEAAQSAQAAWEKKRFRVARLDPPQTEETELVVRWDALTTWAAQKRAVIDSELEQLTAATDELSKEKDELTTKLEERFKAEDIELVGDPEITAARAHQEAMGEVKGIAEARIEAEEVRSKIVALEREAQLARSLVTHLRSDRFEGWLLDEALHTLAEEANGLLDDLSSGTYSLDVEDREFVIIDHRNLDARRDVRTLSGGETFLASLALALSLATQLGEMATEGTAPLDAIFLDEGFGTLDAETLDTVASVVTELSARGRVVGIVTHVRDLADRIPVRFVITRDGSTAQVGREER